MQSNAREQSRVFPTLGYSVAEMYYLLLSIYPLCAIEMGSVWNLCSELDGVVKTFLIPLQIQFELSHTLQLDLTCLFVSMLRGAVATNHQVMLSKPVRNLFLTAQELGAAPKRGRHTRNSCQKYLLCCHQVASDKHRANKLELMRRWLRDSLPHDIG